MSKFRQFENELKRDLLAHLGFTADAEFTELSQSTPGTADDSPTANSSTTPTTSSWSLHHSTCI